MPENASNAAVAEGPDAAVAVAGNIGFFFGSAPDHDMYPTHLENENFDKTKDWGELQARHSADFCTGSTLITRFMGGINFQIEHHLFPTLCNHHLPAIAPIVKRTCKEFGVPYTSVEAPADVFHQVLETYMHVHTEAAAGGGG